MKKLIGKISAFWSTLAAACCSVSLYHEMAVMFSISAAALLLGIVTLIICMGKECKNALLDIIEIFISY